MYDGQMPLPLGLLRCFGFMVAYTPAMRAAIAEAIAVEEAWCKLRAVAGDERMDELGALVCDELANSRRAAGEGFVRTLTPVEAINAVCDRVCRGDI
jgi:hypothetical protein